MIAYPNRLPLKNFKTQKKNHITLPDPAIIRNATYDLSRDLNLSRNERNDILLPVMASVTRALNDCNIPVITPKPSEITNQLKEADNQLITLYGLKSKYHDVTSKKESEPLKVDIVSVDLSKFLSYLFTLPNWDSLYRIQGNEALALLYCDGTPTRNFSEKEDHNNQVSLMLQFISANKLQRSVKSVITFCTYDGAEKKGYMKCLEEVLGEINDVKFKYHGRDVKV